MSSEITTINTSRVSPHKEFAEEGNLGILGKAIDFKKGVWLIDDQEVKDGERFVADMNAGFRCVVKWFDGHPVDGTFQIASIVRREMLPSRSELGDHDDTLWEEGLDGRPRDPWVYGHRQVMKGGTDGSLYTFRTSSWGGKRALQMLNGQYDLEKDQHPGQSPIIELNQERVKNKTFGLIPEPRFPIVGWSTLDGDLPPQIEVTSDDPRTQVERELEDEIPF